MLANEPFGLAKPPPAPEFHPVNPFGVRRFLPHSIAAIFFLALLVHKFDSQYGFSELAGFGADYDRPKVEALQDLSIYHKPNSTGYDGQFYAQIALDPALRDPLYNEAIDHPSYRARRILLPTTSYLLGLGQPAAILQIHSLLNVVCLIACGLLLLHWIPAGTPENFARWFCCIFSMGALESVRYSLADLPSLTLALATVALLDSKKDRLALVSNALSALTKETSLINAAIFLKPGSTRSLRNALVAGICAMVPLGIWMLYVSYVFPLTLNSSDNIEAPFFGIYRGVADAIIQLSNGGEIDRYLFRIVAIAGLLFQLVYLVAKPMPLNRIWILRIIYGVLFLTLGDAVWRGYWAACRIALPLTVAFNILLSSKNRSFFWPALIISNLTNIHAIIRWL